MKPAFDEHGLATTAGELSCFYYSSETGEYTGWSKEYINIGVSMPGNSTDIDPGDEVAGEVSIFTGGGWQRQEDHRGETVWSTADGSPIIVDYIGPVRDGFVAIAPESPYDDWNGECWVKDTDAEHAALVATSGEHKQLLITQANDFINRKQWPGKAAIGRLKVDEMTQYNLWLDYLDALEAVDTTTAPDITWPDIPD